MPNVNFKSMQKCWIMLKEKDLQEKTHIYKSYCMNLCDMLIKMQLNPNKNITMAQYCFSFFAIKITTSQQ